MTKDVNLRELALDILLAVTRDGEYSHIVLKDTLDKYQYLSKQERAFLTRLCQGTLERMIWIDYVLDQFSAVKVNKMKPVIRCILRMGVYQLKFMDSVPDSAVCNEAVKLAQKRGFQNLKGFVNGVLRNIGRSPEPVRLPDKVLQPAAWMSVTYSMPEWILKEWLETYTMDQTEEILQAFLQEAPTGIRVNTDRITREELKGRLEAEGVTVTVNQEVPQGLFLSGYDYLNALSSFREGLFYVQDTGSMLVSRLSGVKQDDYILDVCAAPGGKSIHMAELLRGTGMVEARDLTPYKVGLIQENISRCRLKNIRAVLADARQLRPEDVGKADIVIADLPCSGLGVIGKKADIKYKMTPEKKRELAKLQREILGTSARYVKPGGTLMYSTCTISREENEENVSWFLQEHKEYRLEMQQQLLPKACRQDGFFIAKLIKEKNE